MTEQQTTTAAGLYGFPPRELAEAPQGARQLSPLAPGSAAFEDIADGALTSATVLAPPGAVERRYVLAQALRVTVPEAEILVLAPKDRGGARLRKELEAFGCAVVETARRHHRICDTRRPRAPVGVDQAIAGGAPRLDGRLALWTQPGVFSWDRIDPGSQLLAQSIPHLKGEGADLGCGVGYLAHGVLASTVVTRLHMVDIDRRAVDCARRNAADPRVTITWADARDLALANLDFVVMNPPFHDAGAESKRLGQAFIRSAASALRKGGVLHLVANRHLPYESVLRETFGSVEQTADDGGYKVFQARK